MALRPSPVTLLANEPVPLPSIVLKLAIVGFGLVLQHTPRTEIGESPSLDMLPPVEKDVPVMEVASIVVRLGLHGFQVICPSQFFNVVPG